MSPVFKKGSRSVPANYRPVALTCILCKVLEHVVCSNINRQLATYSWLSNYQHGFRARRSCESQLLIATNDLNQALNQNGRVDAAVLDFSKAFDKVPHRRLLRKLDHCGVRGDTLKWLEHFLIGRKQRVVIDGVESDECDVVSGVPQGSVLGPLLFIIFINDIGAQLSPDTQIRLFADDALVYRVMHSHQDVIAFQADLDKLTAWADKWCMSFNVDKCYAMHFMNRGRKSREVAVPYSMKGQLLERVEHTKYLGVTLADTLSWRDQTSQTSGKAHSSLAFLERNLWMLPRHLKERAYFTIVRPAVEYASAIADPYLVKDVAKLEAVQRHAARFVTGNPRRRYDPEMEHVSVTQLLEELKWESLQARRQSARCVLMFKVLRDVIEVPDSLKPKTSHGRSLRSATAGNLPHIIAQNEVYNHSFFPRTVRDWNELPAAAKTAPELEQFKTILAKQP